MQRLVVALAAALLALASAGSVRAEGRTGVPRSAVKLREQRLREVHRPMLTSSYLARLGRRQGGDADTARGAAFGAQP